MEFRIFLPYCLPSDIEWVPDVESLGAYEGRVVDLLNSFGLLESSFSDSRDDLYVIGGPRFGIKYRAGSKLEVKIRTEVYEHHIEQWEKEKYGKKAGNPTLAHHANIIVDLLHKKRVYFPGDDVLITEPQMIGVSKERNTKQLTENIDREVCMLRTNVHERKWLSIALEGPLLDIKQVLRGKELTLVWDALLCALTVANTNNLKTARERTFIPVVGGFPSWVRIASAHATNGEVDGVVGNVNAFLSSIQFGTTTITPPPPPPPP